MYKIDIEDLVANSLIALYEKKGEKSVTFSLAEKYGRAIVNHMRESGKKAILVLSRNHTIEFLNYESPFFNICETSQTYVVTLKDNVDFDTFRDHYRGYLALDVLLAMVNDNVLSVLFKNK